jgi:hypothetical protein
MKSLFALFTLAASLAVVPATPVGATVADGVRKLSFDVFLDDRAIGYQRFELAPAEGGTRIETQAAFEVKLLLITAFAYDHRNSELWRGGCLQAIDSSTDSNGKRYTVSGRARGSAFVVATGAGERSLGDCVVRIDSLGTDRVRIGQRDVAVERYALKGQGLDITLAYAVGGGDWVALDSRLDGGRTLRYRRSPGELDASPVVQGMPRTAK